MKLFIFTIRDDKAEAYGTPFFMPTRGQAIRAFADLVNDPQSAISKHPGDYRLFLIGAYDPQDAGIDESTTPELLAHGPDFQHHEQSAVPLSIKRQA